MKKDKEVKLFTRSLLAAFGAVIAAQAHAQLLEELTPRRDGNDAVIEIKFSSPVSLLQSTKSKSNEVVQVYYRYSSSEGKPDFLGTDKLSYSAAGLPAIQITDDPFPSDGPRDANRRLVIVLKPGVQHQIRQGKTNWTIDLVMQGLGQALANQNLPKVAAVRPIAPISPIASQANATPAAKSAEEQARQMLAAATQAYQAKQWDAAEQALAQLFDLPANPVQADAQELMGMMRQAQGDDGRARAEYQAYLKLYPTGSGADRVKGRLAALQSSSGKATNATASADKSEDGTPTVEASISQYYYGGQSTVATQAIRDTDGTPLSPDQIDQSRTSPISSTDQKLLTTNTDITWRSRNDEREIRAVVRDQYDYNMIGADQLGDKSRSRNRMSNAYIDYKQLTGGRLTGRLGRQSAMWGGEGRYDGVSTSYSFPHKLKTSFALGVPTDTLGASQRYFVGAALDADALTSNMSGSLFMLQRMIDGEVDRRAVGADLRYYTQNASLMASSDYDILFKKLNSVSLMGMYLGPGNTTANVLLERRSQLPASLGQTLFFQFPELVGIVPQTIDDLTSRGYTVDQLRDLVRLNTSYSTHALASVSKPLTPHWQMGADIDFRRFGDIAPNPVLLTGQKASAPQRTLGMQLIGTNLYSARDTSVLAVSIMNSSDVKTKSFSINNMSFLHEYWQIEPSVRWQRTVVFDHTTGINIYIQSWGPEIKLLYKPKPFIELESNLTYDNSKTEGITNLDRSKRFSYYLGYRYAY